MLKPLIQLLLASLLCFNLHAQQTQTDSIPLNQDSIERELDAFLKMFDPSQKGKSYFLVAVGVGNTQFSVKNIALNSQQSANNLSVIPTLAYYHKSGVSASYNNYLLKEDQSFQLLQHSVTLGYDFPKTAAAGFGFSYTHFFGKKEFVNSSSPYDHDLLAYVNRAKGIFQPGMMLGYSAGKYREISSYLDSVRVLFPGPGYRYFYVVDTSTTTVRDFSVIPYLQWEFEWEGKGKKDYFQFHPSLMFIAGLQYYKVQSKGGRSVLKYPRLRKAYNLTAADQSKFNLYSVGLNLDAIWYHNKFYVNPQIYMDDYLLSSNNKFNFLFTVQIGYMF